MNTIETERLLLRPWKIDDAAEAASLFRYASDPEIGLRCGWPPHTSVEGSMHDIRNILAVENNWAITIKGGAPMALAAWWPSSIFDRLLCAVLATVPGNSARVTGVHHERQITRFHRTAHLPGLRRGLRRAGRGVARGFDDPPPPPPFAVMRPAITLSEPLLP